MAANLAGLPSRLQLVVRGGLYGQLRSAAGTQAVEEQRQVAVAQRARALGVADLQRGELLEDRAEVVDGGVGADRARLLGAREQRDVELARALHEGGERLPGVLLVRERGLRRLDVAPQAIGAERA